MNKNHLIILAVLIAVIIYFYYARQGDYDDFAKCLTDKGAKFYGAFWCPHCKEQKELFGASMKYINYIECSTPDGNGQTPECVAANIRIYPTWEFSNGSKISAVQSMKELSDRTGCIINSSSKS